MLLGAQTVGVHIACSVDCNGAATMAAFEIPIRGSSDAITRLAADEVTPLFELTCEYAP